MYDDVMIVFVASLTAKQLVDQRELELMSPSSSMPSSPCPVTTGDDIDDKSNGVYLTYLLSSKQLSRDEIYANLMELMIAGTDTVSSFEFVPHVFVSTD